MLDEATKRLAQAGDLEQTQHGRGFAARHGQGVDGVQALGVVHQTRGQSQLTKRGLVLRVVALQGKDADRELGLTGARRSLVLVMRVRAVGAGP